MKIIKWGIIGTGGIAKKFAIDNRVVENSELYGVCGTSHEKAKKFADEYDVKIGYSSLEEMLNSEEIDAIYIASPNNFHYEQIKACFKYKKDVLCEKPLVLTTKEFEYVMSCSKTEGRILMETMWSAHLPAIKEIKNILDKGEIGKIKGLSGDFSFYKEYDPNQRLFNKNLGGGAILDIGVYLISAARHLLDREVEEISTHSILTPTGVDLRSNMSIKFKGNILGNFSCGFDYVGNREMIIYGELGNIRINQFWRATSFDVIHNQKLDTEDIKTNSYNYELDSGGHEYIMREFNNILRNNKKDSEIYTLEDSYEVNKIMIKALDDIGVNFS